MAKHERRGALNSTFPIPVSLGLALLVGAAGGARAGPPEWKSTFHQDLRTAALDNPNLRPLGEKVRFEPAGLRISLPAGRGKLPTTGLSTTFQVRGDFEITLSYEVLKAEQPT